MAIERVAQNVDFGSAPQAGAIPDNVQNAQPDVNKFKNNDTINPPQPSFLDGLVDAFLPAAKTLAANAVSASREEAYLNGQSAAAGGLAQDTVNSNILTKDWATAGYSDTKGRLAQADAEAQTATDMDKLKEQSPEQFQQYLANRRTQLLPSLEGMSLDARKSFLAQQLTSDRAAIVKQAGEHQKFIIDQIGTAVSTDMGVRIDAMDQAKTDPAAYLSAADSAYVGVYGNIWNNPNLPKTNKLQLTEQAATLALARDNPVLYEKMRDTKLPGSDSTMLDQLPFDSQVKLAASYKTALADTATMRLSQQATQMGLMQADFDNPLKPPMSYADFKAATDQWTQQGLIKSPDQITSLTKQWADGNEKKMASGALASNYASGNVQGIFAAGKQESDGYTAFIQTNARNGVSVADTTAQLLQIGVNTGQQSAFKGVGELTRSAVTMIGSGAQIDPSQLQMLNTVLSTLDTAQNKGNTGAMSAYLSSFSDSDRAKIMTYREELQRTGNPTIAASNAADTMAKSSQLSDADRNVLAAQHAQGDKAILDTITPKGLWGTLTDKLPDILRSNDAINTSKISASKSWFENPDRVDQAMAQSKTAMMEELNYISRSSPYASDDSRKRLALAAVADRTVPLADGPLVIPHLPSGTTMQDYFGVNSNIRPDTIAAAINDLHPAANGNRTVYKIDGQSRLQWQELGSDGQFIQGGSVDPKTVAPAVQEKQDAITDRFNATDGAGLTRKDASGAQVQYNGNNTVGANNADMLDFRSALVKHEGVRDTPYDDASGKVVNGKTVQTVGVGVSSTNDNFPKTQADGKVAQADINNSFMQASDQAAKAGRVMQQGTGLSNSNAFKLFSELAYQSGSGFAGNNKDYMQAIRERNTGAALTALKDSTAYKMAHQERKDYYERMTQLAITGG